MDEDDVFHRAFDSQFFADNKIRNPRTVAKAIVDLHRVSHDPNTIPEEVRLAWLQLYDVAGIALLGEMLSTGAWREFAPDVDDPRDSLLSNAVWTNGDKTVTARLVYIQDRPQDLRFTIDDAHPPEQFS